ncbi:MAG TPA: RDD family protein [Tepidisphaeraceae bacterium]|jgi:uncharacterized RDD family membrane protein YckC|nr:RDD family protein [Tepidisphaeraceae bacterium]
MKNLAVSFLCGGVAFGACLGVMPSPLVAAGAPALSISAPPQPRDLFAQGSENHFWIAHVAKSPDGNYSQTEIVFRSKWSGSGDWTPMPSVADRVVSMAASNDELLVVLANGQWEIADEADIRTGPTPPQGDVLLAIANDQETVWAVVRGTIPPPLPASTAPSKSRATGPSTQLAEPSTEPAEPRLLVCQFVEGKWIDPHPLPDDVSEDPAQMSLAVVNQLPMLAWRRSDGRLLVSALTSRNNWTRPVLVESPTEVADFKMLTIHDRAVLWLADAPWSVDAASTSRPTTRPRVSGAGVVLIGNDFARRIPLQMPTTLPSNVSSQTLVVAFGNLRWLAYAGDKQIEQDYGLENFPDSFPPAKMSVVASPAPPVIPLMPWVGGDAVLVLAAAMVAIRQRQLSGSATPPAADGVDAKLHLAPLGVRFVAGLVDLAPILAVAAIIHPANSTNPLAGVDAKSLENLFGLAALAYALHTLVAELICGQSLGKMAFGLRVVDPEGKPPKAWAIVVRNLLRVVDVFLVLPLLMVLVSPLRQRVGDVLAGTVVIAKDGEGDEQQ